MITHPSGSGVRNVRRFMSETPPEVGIRMPCGGVLMIVYGRRGTPFWGRRPSGEALTVRTRPPAVRVLMGAVPPRPGDDGCAARHTTGARPT